MKLRPNSIEAMLGFVNADVALQKWDEVLATYQKILVLDPNNTLVNYRIALYDAMLLMAQVKLAGGKLIESKTYYQCTLPYNPSNDEIKKVLNKL